MKFIYQLAFFGAIASASPVVVPLASLELQARSEPPAFSTGISTPEDIHTDDANCKCKRCSPEELQGIVSMGSNLISGLTSSLGGGSLSSTSNTNTGLNTINNLNTQANNINNLNTQSNNINNLNTSSNNINNLNTLSNNINNLNTVSNSNGVTTDTTTLTSGCGNPGQPPCYPGQPTPASSGSLSLFKQTTTSNGRFTLPDGRQCCACPA